MKFLFINWPSIICHISPIPFMNAFILEESISAIEVNLAPKNPEGLPPLQLSIDHELLTHANAHYKRRHSFEQSTIVKGNPHPQNHQKGLKHKRKRKNDKNLVFVGNGSQCFTNAKNIKKNLNFKHLTFRFQLKKMCKM